MLNFFKGLGIGLLCILCFIIGLIFKTEFLNKEEGTKQVLIFTNELELSTKLKPDIFNSELIFSATEALSTKASLSNADKASITSSFNEILLLADKSNFCKGGSYSIEPTFSYEDGLQLPKGQRFNASLTCSIKENQLELYNKLINELSQLASKSEYFTLSLPSLRVNFSSEQVKTSNKLLKERLIKQALADSDEYSTLSAKTCVLKEFNFSAHNQPVLRASSLSAKANDETNFSLSLPVFAEEERSLSANVLYECK